MEAIEPPAQDRVCAEHGDAIATKQPSVTARVWAYRSLTAPLNYFDFTVSRHRDGSEGPTTPPRQA